MSKPKIESYANVWDAIADTPEEAANLRVRSDLMDKIAAIVEEKGWTQLEAAGHCGVSTTCCVAESRVSRSTLW